MTGASETSGRLLAELDRARKTIRQVRERKGHIGETQTKASLINPILEALGWDATDLDEVVLEYRHKPQDNPVDYALFLHRSPRLFVEAKALDTELDDHKWKSQVVNYANAAGVEWCVLTDGNKYCIYNTHAPVDVDQKLFRTVVLSDTTQEVQMVETLELLSKEKLSDNLISVLWKAHFIDRSVQAVLGEILRGEDTSFIRLIRKRTPELAPSEIRDSLKRSDCIISFPTMAPPTPSPSTAQPSAAPCPSPSLAPSSWVRISDLLSSGLVRAGDEWRCTLRNDVSYSATVTTEGSLLMDGGRYGSPSAAGMAATGWKSFDGWRYWRYQDGEGNWRPIAELRQQLHALRGKQQGREQAVSASQQFGWGLTMHPDGSFVMDCRYLADETRSFRVKGKQVPPEQDFRPARTALLEEIYEAIRPLFPNLPDARIRAKAWSGVHKVYPAERYYAKG